MAETTSTNRIGRLQRLRDSISKLNLFNDVDTLSPVDQLLATRVMLVLFSTTLIVIISFALFSPQTYYVTVSSPSEAVFEELSLQYSDTLSCPCSQTAVRTDAFISFRPLYHPICSSQFVNQSFISSLSDANRSGYFALDYRVTVVSHLRILAIFCEVIKNVVWDALDEFAARHITTTAVLSYEAFNAQCDQRVEQLKTTSTADMQHTSDFLWLNIVENSIYSALRTNYQIRIISNVSIITFSKVAYSTKNGTCHCTGNTPCTEQAAFYNFTKYKYVRDEDTNSLYPEPVVQIVLLIPGMLVGCLPYNSLLQSTLECFYNRACIDRMAPFIPGFSRVSPLSSSSSRFERNTTVKDLFDQLFIETWRENRKFSGYFKACAPYSCTYSYMRRVNVMYAIVTIISLFTGLQMIMPLLTLVIIKVFLRLKKFLFLPKSTDEIATETGSDSQQNFKDRLINFMQQVKMKLVSFNMFPSSDTTDGLYATRLYVAALVTAVIVLVFYSSLSVQIEHVSVQRPSLTKYERLHTEYPSTLKCPCTRLSVRFSSIVNIAPHFHQVCASDFIKDDGWLLYFIRNSGYVSNLDFRATGSELFRILCSLCRMANETITNELAVLNNMQFVSAEVLPVTTFKAQILSIIRQFERQTMDSFLGLFELVRMSIQLNQFVIYPSPNAVLVRTSDSQMLHFRPKTSFDDSCSCGKDVSCTRPQGFYCTDSVCITGNPQPNQTIPGLILGCLFVDSLLASSLQCFYEASCIQMVLKWRPFGLPYVQMPSMPHISALDPTVDSRFPPGTILKDIVSQLFIEHWTNAIDFSSYYNQCAPQRCTYTYEERFNKAYIIATVLGVIGGLSVVLQILIPLVVKLCRRLYRFYRHRRSHAPTRTMIKKSILQECAKLIAHIWQFLQTVNLYKTMIQSRSADDVQTRAELLIIQRQRIATRWYLICFVLALVVIIALTALQSQIYSVTVPSPTLAIFESLHAQYASTLSCPCSRIAIPYSEFISVQPTRYHQVCSSYFITSHFINLLWGSQLATDFYFTIDGKILSTEFRLLAALCSLAQKIVEQKRQIFAARELISLEVSTRETLQSQIESIISAFTVQTEANFRVTHRYIVLMMCANQLHNLFFTNWYARMTTSKGGYYVSTHPQVYSRNGRSCSCETSATCIRSLLTRENEPINIPGLVYGCLPIYGLRLSSLECLYNATCLQALSTFVGSAYVPLPMRIPTSSRFQPVSTIRIGTIMDSLFIEAWQNTSNYSNYFAYCAPSSCRYSYVKKNNAIYMITTFLALYGGLTVILKFLMYHSLHIYWKDLQWICKDQSRVRSLNDHY